jgi:prepilin-type N-terminal cleavage/methylation domain-containing protein
MKVIKNNTAKKLQSGFTLIELLIVIVIITALAVTVFVALNPVKRVKDAHDSRRASDVETILTAIHEYIVDNNGSLPTSLSGKNNGQMYIIGTCASGCNTNTLGATYSPSSPAAFACGSANSPAVNLSTDLANYLKSVPVDPLSATTSNSYSVTISTNNLITVTACYPEDTASISQSR